MSGVLAPTSGRRPWEEDVILVSGYARTGTTLMQGLLCASDDLMGVSAEAKLFRSLLKAHVVGLVGWEAFTSDYFADRSAYRTFMRQILGFYLAHVRERFATQKRLVQKVPQDALPHIFELADLLPNSKFVMMVRDPRAALASTVEFQGRYGKRLDFGEELDRFVRLYAPLVRRRHELRGRLVFVRYEQLVTDVTPTMARVGDFLSVRVPTDLESLEWENKRVKTLAEASPLDGRRVSTASLTNYRQALTPQALEMLERRREEIEQAIGMPVFYDERGPHDPAVLV